MTEESEILKIAENRVRRLAARNNLRLEKARMAQKYIGRMRYMLISGNTVFDGTEFWGLAGVGEMEERLLLCMGYSGDEVDKRMAPETREALAVARAESQERIQGHVERAMRSLVGDSPKQVKDYLERARRDLESNPARVREHLERARDDLVENSPQQVQGHVERAMRSLVGDSPNQVKDYLERARRDLEESNPARVREHSERAGQLDENLQTARNGLWKLIDNKS